MKDEIKEILDFDFESQGERIEINEYERNILKDYITNLQEENDRLKDLYRRTCNHLFNIGNDELARYFQAQINECNTFTVQGVGKNE